MHEEALEFGSFHISVARYPAKFIWKRAEFNDTVIMSRSHKLTQKYNKNTFTSCSYLHFFSKKKI